ncbi:MAG: DUF421 domain-containing protein [Bacteroidales bacterium]
MHDSNILTHMFVLGVPVFEKVLRTVGVYVVLVILIRLAGKRELAQLNPFDLVVLLTLSNAVQNAIIGDDNSFLGGAISATTLLALNYAVVRFLYGHERLERIVEGRADVLVENGVVNERQLARELVSREELEVAARKQGFGSLDDVDRAELEPGGGIVFTARKPKPEEERQQELVARLDRLLEEVAALRRERRLSTNEG